MTTTHPKKKQNLKQKGNQYYKQGQYAMASAMYRKYIAKPHQDNKNAYYNMSLCLYKLQKYQQCIQACKQSLKLDNNYIKVYYRLALAYQMLGKNLQCFVNAQQFCNKIQNLQSVDYRQMKQLRNKMRNRIMYPSQITVQQKNKIFYERYQERLKQDDKVREYFKGYSWNDVQNDIDNQEYVLALDKTYWICKNNQGGTNDVKQQINRKNLEIVKGIKAGTLSKDTKLIIQTSKKQKQSNRKVKQQVLSISASSVQKKQNQNAANISIITASDSTNQNKPQLPKQNTQTTSLTNYDKYFVSSLQKKLDIFEGFPAVVISILHNKTLQKQQIQSMLKKASKQYQMFMVLQMSLSQTQKLEIKKQMRNCKIAQEIIDIYCS